MLPPSVAWAGEGLLCGQRHRHMSRALVTQLELAELAAFLVGTTSTGGETPGVVSGAGRVWTLVVRESPRGQVGTEPWAPQQSPV